CAETCSARSTCPSPKTRNPCVANLRITPESTSCCGPTLDPFSNRVRSLTLIVENCFLNGALVNPRFGIRRCNGIWPPSNPRFWLLPERDHIPLLPRAAVFPCPEPGPRPMRFVLCVDPGSGRSVLMPAMLLLQNSYQVRNFCDHTSNRRRILSFSNPIQFSH